MGRARMGWLAAIVSVVAGCASGPGDAVGSTKGTSTTRTTGGAGGAGTTSGAGGATTGAGGAGTTTGAGGAGTTTGAGGAGTTTGAGGAGTTTGAGGAGGAAPVPPGASFVSRTFRCKLLSNAFLEDPTPNHVQTRFNLKGSDLGIPVVVGPSLHLFFGDTVGYKAIWGWGEDPDSVAHLPLADVASDPTKVCSALEFAVTPDDPSVAHGVDPAILRDFAGASMTPPPGAAIGDFVAQPAGPFAHMPGTFEVPGGGVALGGKAYLFYAGRVELAPRTRATMSYLARWDAPGGLPDYTIVRPFDDLAGGALGGHFVQASPVRHAGHVYVFGTGDYRRSGVHLARLPEAAIESGAGQELYDPGASQWRLAAALSPAERAAVAPLFEVEGVGEISVSYVEAAGVFVALYQREQHDANGAVVDNRVVVRVAAAPEGPWSAAVTITDMADPAFRAAHCCGGPTCPGAEILHCEKAGLYGAYLLPVATVAPAPGGGRDLDLPFLVSTWDPYNVVIFSTKIHLTP